MRSRIVSLLLKKYVDMSVILPLEGRPYVVISAFSTAD